MNIESEKKSYKTARFLSQNPRLRFFIISILFMAAISVRLFHIDRPPLDFNPIRQYQSAHIAREYYYEKLESIPEWKRKVARLNSQRMGFDLEPRIVEHLAVAGYRLTGGEYLWIPRTLSSVFWIMGGVFLYLMAKKMFSYGVALFSTAFYLFLPYSILASRVFQPDPLMVMLMLCGIYLIMKYFEHPSPLKLISAALISTSAMFLKPYSVFIIFGAFLPLAVLRHGLRRFIISRDVLILSFLSLLPAASFYFYGLVVNAGALREHTEGSFMPRLLLESYFWKDWFVIIGTVIGYIPFALALIGLLKTHERYSRYMLSGLWLGYLVFGLMFTFHIHTHSYYQMQFIPVVALSIGPIGAQAVQSIFNLFLKKKMATIIVIIALVLAVVSIIHIGGVTLNKNRDKDNIKIVGRFIGVDPGFLKFLTGDYEKDVRISKEIGEIIGHSTNTVFLTPDFGRSLAYYGELSGLPWPVSISLSERKERGVNIPQKEELFNTHYITIRTHGKYIRYTPDFFIITAFDEFEKQEDLKSYLNSNFSVFAQNENYLIFDMRKMSD